MVKVSKATIGSEMSWKTELEGLYSVGQWAYPGFSVASVMESGYYVAQELLKNDRIDLESDFNNAFPQK